MGCENAFVEDRIISIKRVGMLDELSSEIFITFEHSPFFSADRFCYSHYEDLWLNAKEGMKVHLLIEAGCVQSIQLS